MVSSLSVRAAASIVLVALPAIGIQLGGVQLGPTEGSAFGAAPEAGVADLKKAFSGEDSDAVIDREIREKAEEVTEDNLLMDSGEEVDAPEDEAAKEGAPPEKDEQRRLLSEFQELGLEPGCYVRTPGGCPSHPSFHSVMWKHEVYGEKYKRAKANRTVCEVDRRTHVMHWCGAEDAETLFVPRPPPGCYVRTPSGCPNHPSFGGKAWQHEEYGERNGGSRLNRTECEVSRKIHVEHWCGVADVEMLFVPVEEEESLLGLGLRRRPPNEPGCFVRTPRGCPNQPNFASVAWKHDQYAERFTSASSDRSACEEQRRQHVMRMCGTSDVEMAFIPSDVLQPPRKPGCFFRTPSGCPRRPAFHSADWKRDDSDGRSAMAGMDRTVCEVHRREHLAKSCGVEDVEMLHVPAPEPGCYVRTPSGCPSHPSFGSPVWRHDEYGEKHTKARGSRIECEVTRKDHVSHWCGVTDAEMLFVPKDAEGHGAGTEITSQLLGGSRTVVAEHPSEPGCFVRTPKGCPNKQHFSATAWRHELYGEQHTDAKLNRTSCEVDRKAHLVHWCGTEEVEVLFIPANSERVKLPLAAPIEPGCHVLLPSGCPNHPTFQQAGGWSHEKWGETYTDAKSSRETCEVTRAEHIRHWCGATDAHTRFVPQPGAEQGGDSSRSDARSARTSGGAAAAAGAASGGEDGPERRQDTASISNDGSASGAAATSGEGVNGTTGGTAVSGAGGADASRAADTAAGGAISSGNSSGGAGAGAGAGAGGGGGGGGSGAESADAAGGPADGFFGFPDASTTSGDGADAGGSAASGSSSSSEQQSEILKRPADPAVPGCYVWTPTGCRKHPSANATGWRREVYGELFANAAKDKLACEVKRKANINEWCGIDDAQMKFVDDMEAAQHEDTVKGNLFAGPISEGVMMFFDLEADYEALLLAETPIQRL